MGVVIVEQKLTKADVEKAGEDLLEYIKITLDISQEIIAIGGKFHADAEKVLLRKYNSKQHDVWGGGYDTKKNRLETNAVLNIRGGKNDSMEILNPEVRKKFLTLARRITKEMQNLI